MRAIYLPQEHALDSHEVCEWLSDAVEALGVDFLNQRCVKLNALGAVIQGATLQSGERVHASTVVCAAGAFTTPILDTVLPFNQVQPVFAGTGIAFVSDRNKDRKRALSHTIRTVNRGGSCGLHVVPLSDGSDYIGATNAIFHQPNTHATAGLSHFLLQCAIDQLDQWYAHAPIACWRIGNRPVTLDTFPLLGASGIDGLFIATGTYRDGFHASPVIAKIIADKILDGCSTISHPFEPTRRPISVFSVAESIDECRRHAMCTGFEASLILPRLWPHDAIKAAFFPTGNKHLYNLLDLAEGLPPDLVPFLSASAASTGTEREPFDRVQSLLRERGMSRDVSGA